MKRDKNMILNLILIIISPLLVVAGVLTVVLTDSNRLDALGGLFILLGLYLFIMWSIRALAMRAEKKRNAQKELVVNGPQKPDEALDEALRQFEKNRNYPETNTLNLVEAGMEFYAEGRYVCEENFKDIRGYHFAFEISSTELKFKPDDYDDVCDIEGTGVLIAAGYHDGEALEKYANDCGIILREPFENLVGKTLTLKHDKGYSFYVTTAESDEANYGFIKILKCEDGVLTVYFSIDVPYGLCDTVEGTVELKRDVEAGSKDILTLISKIKRRRYNVLAVSDGEIAEIARENPSLPESYITFLREVGFADLDWIDVGWHEKTATNLHDGEDTAVKDIFADFKGLNYNDYYFFAISNDGSYYAFTKDEGNGKVYCFSTDEPRIFAYSSFEEFLYEILLV